MPSFKNMFQVAAFSLVIAAAAAVPTKQRIYCKPFFWPLSRLDVEI